MVEAHMICVAGSRIPEMRLFAITNIKEMILSGFHYFSKDVFQREKMGSFEFSGDEGDHKGFQISLKLISQSCELKPQVIPFSNTRNTKTD
jgi:hypothetical protein